MTGEPQVCSEKGFSALASLSHMRFCKRSLYIFIHFLFQMVGKKEKKRGKWKLIQMQRAVRDVIVYHWSVRKASKENNVPRETLKRHLKKANDEYGVEKVLGRKPTLTSEQEDQLQDVALDMEAKLFGLTQEDLRRHVYVFCEVNGITHRFNKEEQLAGKSWLKGFLKRHPMMKLRIPEATSFQRAIGFNIPKVDQFMKVLKEVLFDKDGSRVITDENIFNVDESGYTNCHKP